MAHAAYNLGGIDTSRDSDRSGGPLRLSAGLSVAWDLDPDRVADLALRLAPELLVKLRRVSLFGAFYLGFARRGESVADQRLAMMGAVAQTSYFFPRGVELAARYALVHVDGRVAQSARRRASAIIAAAVDEAEREALTHKYRAAGTLRREHEATLGVNLHLIGRSLKLQWDVSWLAHEYQDGASGHDLRVRTQLQLLL